MGGTKLLWIFSSLARTRSPSTTEQRDESSPMVAPALVKALLLAVAARIKSRASRNRGVCVTESCDYGSRRREGSERVDSGRIRVYRWRIFSRPSKKSCEREGENEKAKYIRPWLFPMCIILDEGLGGFPPGAQRASEARTAVFRLS